MTSTDTDRPGWLDRFIDDQLQRQEDDDRHDEDADYTDA